MECKTDENQKEKKIVLFFSIVLPFHNQLERKKVSLEGEKKKVTTICNNINTPTTKHLEITTNKNHLHYAVEGLNECITLKLSPLVQISTHFSSSLQPKRGKKYTLSPIKIKPWIIQT